jgi:hypothetical protein
VNPLIVFQGPLRAQRKVPGHIAHHHCVLICINLERCENLLIRLRGAVARSPRRVSPSTVPWGRCDAEGRHPSTVPASRRASRQHRDTVRAINDWGALLRQSRHALETPEFRLLTDAVEKVSNCFATNFPPKDETRDDCSSIRPQASCRSHWRVSSFDGSPHTFIRSPRFGLDGRESYRELRLELLCCPHRLSRGTAPHEREYPRRTDRF